MAFRRLTRSLSRTTEQQPIRAPEPIRTNRKKMRQKETPDETAVDMDLGLEAALNPAADFLPLCFQSQPRPTPSSQLSDGISFSHDLLQPSEALTDLTWKYECEDTSPGTQLEMVSGIDQILESSSLLYSPVSSVAPAASSPPHQQMTSAEELLNYYLPSPGPSASPLSDDGSSAHISDEDLLDDLDSILSSYVEPQPDGSLSNIHIGFNPPADTVELALSSDYVEGLYVIEEPSQTTPSDEAVAAVAAPSVRGKGKKAVAAPAAKRGRKRKASSESDTADERKKRQNAEAAKNYRKRKAEQMNKVFEEKEEVEKELEKARKKLLGKLNERNILLKMLYESYKENGGQSAPHKILFPAWIESWYQKQQDD